MKINKDKYFLLAIAGFVLGGLFGLSEMHLDNIGLNFLWGALICMAGFIGAGWLYGNKDDGGCFLTIGAILACTLFLSLTTGDWTFIVMTIVGLVFFLIAKPDSRGRR